MYVTTFLPPPNPPPPPPPPPPRGLSHDTAQYMIQHSNWSPGAGILSKKKSWSDYIEPFGLTQLVSEATRVTSVSKTLIDHIYSNCPENVTSIDVPKIGLSDHFPIFFTLKMHVQPPKGKHYTISYRSFKNFDEAKFVNDLKNVPWDIIHIF